MTIKKRANLTDHDKNLISLVNLEDDDLLQSQSIKTVINEANSIEDEEIILNEIDTSNGFEAKFFDSALDEHITEIDEFFDLKNFLSEGYGFSLKKGSVNKKKEGDYKLFYAICTKAIRNTKYYAGESKKKGTPSKCSKPKKPNQLIVQHDIDLERIEDSGITIKSCMETHNHELFEESLELSPNMINDIISHPHNTNITYIGSFLTKKYNREFAYSQIYREFRRFYVKFKSNDASNLINLLRERRFEFLMVSNIEDESLTKLIFTNKEMQKYCYPLVILSGSDNQGKNIIFAVAFINDETQLTYNWVLNAFSNLMNSIHPIVIISDQDFAIISAIEDIFPNTTHYLCKWHNERNFIKHFGALSKLNRSLKEKLLSLQYVEEEEEYQEIINDATAYCTENNLRATLSYLNRIDSKQ